MPVSSRPTEPLALMFGDDGSIPNNPLLPLLVYRGAIDLSLGSSAERVVESTFGANGWGDMWRNGIFPYVHYHSMIHEALGIARGRGKVRFGGAAGKILELAPGDVAVLPAGTGHQCLWATPELCVIGAYPKRGSYSAINLGILLFFNGRENTAASYPHRCQHYCTAHGIDGPKMVSSNLMTTRTTRMMMAKEPKNAVASRTGSSPRINSPRPRTRAGRSGQ